MPKKMLIDATHPEETRVVVVDGTRVEEFDFESSNRRQLSGNIYLAKVTRVEPSLQAAFVEYGGNRHGFLAFNEIHPDYYQIPLADREALLAAEEAERDDDDDAAPAAPKKKPAKARSRSRKRTKSADAVPPDADNAADGAASAAPAELALQAEASAEPVTADADAPLTAEASAPENDASATPEATGAAAPEPDAPAVADDTTPADPATGDPDDAATGDAAADDAGADDGGIPGPRSIAEGAGADDAERVTGEIDVADKPESEGAAADGAGRSDGDDDDTRTEAESRSSGRRRTRGRRRRKGAEAPRADAAQSDGEADKDADSDTDGAARDDGIEDVGASEPREEAPRRKPRMRSYKIQEVIKVRQIMLVQVVKEERGNKGAALTTYLSLAGRYCVLMPNTARGGGISRKITQAEDRKKLKEIAGEFEVPKGMGVIIRTAGANRTRAEIRRDYEYLLRQWEEIRALTLQSVAPTLIYEEGSLIKRSIRDLYAKDIDEVLVEGEEGYREAKDYMRMLMPSHAKNVKQYKDLAPVFTRFQVESQLSAMFNPTVQLKSGGYIVIGITEALVAIDVNSGRSTREGSIEDTALKTNLEAADEVARQLRLRDLAGLIVIDFIDMDERRNNAAVEKRVKDRLSSDRARIQIGRISGFGLMEMSRQRLRPGMLEASTAPCHACHGTGLVRSQDSLALAILRAVEEEGLKGRAAELRVTAPVEIANYIMNEKRAYLLTIEQRYGLNVIVAGDFKLQSPDYSLEKVRAAAPRRDPASAAIKADGGFEAMEDPRDEPPAPRREPEARAETPPASATTEEDDEARNRRRRGKRGGRRRRRDDDGAETPRDATAPSGMEVMGDDAEGDDAASATVVDAPENDAPRPKSRRRRRRSGGDTAGADASQSAVTDGAPAENAPADDAAAATDAPQATATPVEGSNADEPFEHSAAARPQQPDGDAPADPAPPLDVVADAPTPEAASPELQAAEAAAPAASDAAVEVADAPPAPKRRGWWNLGRG